jgi:hypothetical protein
VAFCLYEYLSLMLGGAVMVLPAMDDWPLPPRTCPFGASGPPAHQPVPILPIPSSPAALDAANHHVPPAPSSAHSAPSLRPLSVSPPNASKLESRPAPATGSQHLTPDPKAKKDN